MNKKIICAVAAISLIFTSAGCNKASSDPIVAKVNDYNITLSEFDFYLNNIKQQMQGTELSSDEDWKTMDINGKKAIEIAKEKALDLALDNIAYIEIYEKLGNKFTDDVNKSIEELKNNVVSQYDQNGGYDEFLKQSNVKDEFIDLLCKSMYCSEQLYKQYTDGMEVTEDEINDFYNEYQNEYFSGYRRAKHVLILTKNADTNEEYSDEQKAEAKKKAEEIYAKAQAGEDFDSLVKEYSEDPGSATNPDGYVFGDGEMVQEFQDCVDSLEIGGIGFCESSFGYHIIQRLPLTADSFADKIKSQILSSKFSDYIGQKKEEYGITLVETDEMAKAMKNVLPNDTGSSNEEENEEQK
ncbi:MAG: peptidylprolyl isomerase [Clostridia bacterium]|nr:peptidylprolyl isomerase [Clostridia bacterium]